jgi:methionyl-tRNA formyltransferase
MMGKKIILMANDRPGLEVCKYILAEGDEIVRLYIHKENNQKLTEEIIAASGCSEGDVFLASELKNDKHTKTLYDLNADFIITVYWAYLINEEILNSVPNTVNFHPALLPVNRGWHPHVHSIIDGSPLGVTLHSIALTADSGPIWAQEEVKLDPYDTAFTIYEHLQNKIIDLFQRKWGAIKNGKITPTVQDESKAVYHKKNEIGKLDEINLKKEMPLKEAINLLRARSFGNRGFAFYHDQGEKVYLNLRLSKDTFFK